MSRDANVTEFYWPGVRVRIEQPVEIIWSDAPAADERWTFVDEQGHGHFWRDGFPTLTLVIDPCTYEDHDPDCNGESHYECSICGEHIRPGTRPADPLRITGARTYELTMHDASSVRTWRFGQGEWDALEDVVRSTIEATLPDQFLTDVQITGPR